MVPSLRWQFLWSCLYLNLVLSFYRIFILVSVLILLWWFWNLFWMAVDCDESLKASCSLCGQKFWGLKLIHSLYSCLMDWWIDMFNLLYQLSLTRRCNFLLYSTWCEWIHLGNGLGGHSFGRTWYLFELLTLLCLWIFL